MKRQALMILTATAVLSACSASNNPFSKKSTETEKTPVPESVILLAAPDQNVQSARVLPSDNCYWYEYAGVVETTLLPLETPDGRQICAGSAEAG